MAATFAVATALPHEAPTGPEGVPDAGNHRLGVRHPMQRGIGEHRIEFVGEGERLAIHAAGIQPQGAGRLDHLGAGIHRHQRAAVLQQPEGESPIATAEIKDPLAGLRREQLHQGRPEIGHEGRVAAVLLGIPVLITGGGHGAGAAP